jgi:hypothetical protein
MRRARSFMDSATNANAMYWVGKSYGILEGC